MNALHDTLWAVCRKLPTDFEPYGERNRDTADPCADCSCGCRHFIPLDGELGHDWGVCANAASPRAGLLTFEHQGCPQFEPAREETAAAAESEVPWITAETAPEIAAEPAASPPLKKLKINPEELIMALEGWGSDETRYLLDTETGDVITLLEDADDDDEEWCEKLEDAEIERYRDIEQLPPHESFKVMEQFALSLPESRARRALIEALSRNKPFRRFKDAVHADLELRDRWFAFRDRAYAALARDWLESEGIEPEWIDPRGGA